MVRSRNLATAALLLTTVSAISVATAARAQTAGATPAAAAAANQPGENPVPPVADVAPTGKAVATDQPANEIVVTANRRAQSLQDVPMSVNVETGEKIEKLKILDAKDVQQLAPGLELTNTVGRNNTATLRGIDFDPDQGTSPAVDLYFNEVPVDAQTAFTAIYDIDQIEVLRGPQGALRGRTSPAGAITIRTRRPDLENITGDFQALGTDMNAHNIQGGVSLPIVPGKLAIRVAGLVDGNRINQVDNITTGLHSRSRTESARLSVAFAPTDNFTVNATYQYLNADNRQEQQVFGPGNAAIGNPPIAYQDRKAVSEGPNRFQNNSNLLTVDANWDLGPVSLNFIGGHQSSLIKSSPDNDAGNAVHNLSQTQATQAPYLVNTAELRLSSNNDGFWNWTVSGFYTKQTGTTTSLLPLNVVVGVPGLPVPVAIVPLLGDLSVPVYARTLAIAGSSRFKFTDKLTLEVALRYSALKNKQFAQLVIPGVAAPVNLVNFDSKNKPLTGAATLTYKFNRDLTAYVAYGRSYRGPTAGVGVGQNVTTDPNLIVSRPEKSNSVEAGLKATLLDRRLSIDVAGFYQKFNGFVSRFNNINTDQGTQVFSGFYAGPPDGSVDSVGSYNYNGNATVKGVEGTLSGRPTDNWDFSVSASYAKARFDNALLPCNTVNAAGQAVIVPNAAFGGLNNVSYCTRNSRLSDVPDFSLTANTEVRATLGQLQPFVRGLFTYRPKVYSVLRNFEYPDREMLNLFVGVRSPHGGWEVSGFVRNLLNQNRITTVDAASGTVFGRNALTATGSPSVVFNSGYRTVSTTTPREIGGSISYHF